MTEQQRPARLARTSEEAFQMGWEDGAYDAPLTDAEIAHMVALHAPYLLGNRTA